MRNLRLLPLGVVLALSTLIGCADEKGDDDAPLSDYAPLFDGVPSNDELPFDIKADGPPPAQHFELIELQSPVKSQGSRGVCSIFSTVALMEHLYLLAGMEDPDFSEQYLQWSAKFEVGSFPNTSGSNNHFNLQAIHRFGIPAEEAWPYETSEWNEFDDPECGENDNKPTRCYTNGAPPPEALEAEKFLLPAGRFINSRRAAIMDHIRVNGTGVVIGLDFFYQSWNHRRSTLPRNLDYWDQGNVLYPNPTDVTESHKQRAGHAVLLVGWDLDKEIPIVDAEGNFVHDDNGELVVEKGFWLFKNSWGTSGFGIDNPHGAGYGWLSMRYVDEHGNARVTDVPDFVAPDPDDGDDDGEGDTFVNDEIVSIPDNDPTGISSTIEVPAGATVGRVTVSVDIAHTWRGDLIVRLRKGDRVVTLHDGTGGGQHDLRTTFDVDDLEGIDREGIWTLEVVDRARFDVGELETWSLTLH
jgi:hypothetical protein